MHHLDGRPAVRRRPAAICIEQPGFALATIETAVARIPAAFCAWSSSASTGWVTL